MKIYTPNREERAFLYQEAQDLQPLMKDLGSLSVMIEDLSKTRAARRFRVTFMVAPESVGMKVQATDADIYGAAIAAKDEVLRQLNAIVNSLPQGPRSSRVRGPNEALH